MQRTFRLVQLMTTSIYRSLCLIAAGFSVCFFLDSAVAQSGAKARSTPTDVLGFGQNEFAVGKNEFAAGYPIENVGSEYLGSASTCGCNECQAGCHGHGPGYGCEECLASKTSKLKRLKHRLFGQRELRKPALGFPTSEVQYGANAGYPSYGVISHGPWYNGPTTGPGRGKIAQHLSKFKSRKCDRCSKCNQCNCGRQTPNAQLYDEPDERRIEHSYDAADRFEFDQPATIN